MSHPNRLRARLALAHLRDAVKRGQRQFKARRIFLGGFLLIASRKNFSLSKGAPRGIRAEQFFQITARRKQHRTQRGSVRDT